MKCNRCDVEMKPGTAIQPTLIPGMSDFGDDDMRGRTMTLGGPGKLVDVMKCPACGRSCTPHREPQSGGEGEQS